MNEFFYRSSLLVRLIAVCSFCHYSIGMEGPTATHTSQAPIATASTVSHHGKLAWLEELNLSGSVVNLSDNNHFNCLPKLKKLNLRTCSINNTTLKLIISMLPTNSITELFLSCNVLTSLPESLGNLKQLHTLDLSYNNIGGWTEENKTRLFTILGKLKQLHTLYLGLNNLTSLPAILLQREESGQLRIIW